jgi:serine/threonine-protein kinase
VDQLRVQRICELFAAASLVDSERRIAFLKSNCGEDQDLFEQVKFLLDFDDRQGVPDCKSTVSTLGSPEIVAGRFRIIRRIGQGGMGTVYEAEDLQLHDHVALKTIRPDIASNPRAVERFRQEIRLGKRVTHSNICRIYDLGTDHSKDGSEFLFLTMQFLTGETLSSRIRRGPVPQREALPLIEDMADALSAAHQAEVIHRDFKSGNVILVPGSPRTCAVVTDFGLARRINDTTSLTGSGLVGTVDYMAPEQIIGGEITPATDIYALGVVMYEMATGKLPFTGDSKGTVVKKHLNDEPRPPRDLVPELDANWNDAILCCLKKLPGDRFHSATELKAAVVQESLKPSVRTKSQRWVRPPQLVAMAVFVLAIASLLWFYRWRFILPSEKRVAVLKFENIGGDPQNDAFCEGFMDALSSKLTQLEQFHGSLSVIPASDVRRDNVKSARDAHRDFDANLVITGSIERSPRGVHLIVNVVEAEKLRQLRSREMTILQSDPEAIQQGVVGEVADLIQVTIHPEAHRLLDASNTKVPGAYDFYLQGLGYLFMGRKTDEAIQEFRHALELDPNYALAYARLGEAYWRKYQATKDRQWIDQAWQFSQHALDLSSQLAAVHITLAVLNSGTGHYDEAIRQAQQAITLDPGNFQAYSELASALDASGQTEKAEATLKRAIELRPGYWNNHMKLGTFYFRHGRYKEAESSYRRVIELVPDNSAGYTNLGVMYHMDGRDSDAERMLKKSLEVQRTPQAVSNLATVYFFEGRYADAVPLMEELVSAGSKDYGIWGNLGDAYRWSPGQADKAPQTYRIAIGLAEEALTVNSHDVEALISLGLYKAKSGDINGAELACRRAVAAAPADGNILFGIATVYEIAGKRHDALRYLGDAIRHGYSLNEIAAEPELRALREDSRYKSVVRMNQISGEN